MHGEPRVSDVRRIVVRTRDLGDEARVDVEDAGPGRFAIELLRSA
jgi:hypothetical protein